MKEILEAERFWLDSYFGNSISQKDKKLWMECNRQSQESVRIMIEFARLHVEAALKKAINNVRIIDDPNSYCGNTGSEYPPDQILDTDAILNSYPLEAIK